MTGLQSFVHRVNVDSDVCAGEPAFKNLVMSLLDKNPATRLGWKGLCAHPFWQTPLGALPLPQERALETFVARHHSSPAGNQRVPVSSQAAYKFQFLGWWRRLASNLLEREPGLRCLIARLARKHSLSCCKGRQQNGGLR